MPSKVYLNSFIPRNLLRTILTFGTVPLMKLFCWLELDRKQSCQLKRKKLYPGSFRARRVEWNLGTFLFLQIHAVGNRVCSPDCALAFLGSVSCLLQNELWPLPLSYTRLRPHTLLPTLYPRLQGKLKLYARFFFLPSRHSVFRLIVTFIFSFKQMFQAENACQAFPITFRRFGLMLCWTKICADTLENSNTLW